MQQRRWRVRAIVPFPKQIVAVEPPDPGEVLPKKLGTESRIPTEQREMGAIRIAIRPLPDPSMFEQTSGIGGQFDLAEILLEIDAESTIQALELAHPLLELVLDRLSFDLQAALWILQTDAHDVTPPVVVGDERDFSIYASYPGDKFARSEDLGSTYTEQTPALADSYDDPGPRVRAELRWYIKALGTPYLHDRFIFLWIAIEMIADDSGVAVTEPVSLRCGHKLTECPECGKTTDLKVRGASIRAYLEQHGGVDPELARKAWKLRQMFHGAIPFDSDELADLPAIVQMLRALVAAELKLALGVPGEGTPIVVAGVVSLHPSVSVGGHGAITESDLTWPE